jgi:hypothetical protein
VHFSLVLCEFLVAPCRLAALVAPVMDHCRVVVDRANHVVFQVKSRDSSWHAAHLKKGSLLLKGGLTLLSAIAMAALPAGFA